MIEKFEVEYVPGGATQNTIRIAQVCSMITHTLSRSLYYVLLLNVILLYMIDLYRYVVGLKLRMK